MKKLMIGTWFVVIAEVAAAVVFLDGCGSSTPASSSAAEDNSASGAIAGAIGGALSGTSASGTQAFIAPRSSSMLATFSRALDFLPEANAASPLCPTFKSTTGCAASSTSMWLTYSECGFGGNNQWNGVLALIDSAGSPSCGTFPKPTGGNGTLTRQYATASSSSTPGSATVTTVSGAVTTIDDATANLANFDNDTISAFEGAGYGAQVTFASGARTQIEIGHHISVPNSFDHSLSGTLSVSETAGASSRTVSGTMTLYHNLLKVEGVATISNVVHTDGCCLPTSGTISILYKAGLNVNPTTAGQKYVGNTETLTFSSTCGQATVAAVDGSSSTVSLNRCF